MPEVISTSSKLLDAHRLISEAFKTHGAVTLRRNVGFPGGNMDINIQWAEDLGIWHAPGIFRGDRLWNGFGTMSPENRSKSLSIACEINFPWAGINRRFGGVLISDGEGRWILGHRGKIGGGKKGVSKKRFWNCYQGKRLTVSDGDREAEIALVADYQSPRFLRQLHWFVLEVERIRASVKQPGRPAPAHAAKTLGGLDPRITKTHSWHEEFAGSKEYAIQKKKIYSEVDHGPVVNALRRELQELRHQVGNDKHRDLYIYRNDRITALFEVKPALSLPDLYTAIGQLIVHSAALKPRPKLILVKPKGPTPEWMSAALSAVNIRTLEFEWHGGAPKFERLKDALT